MICVEFDLESIEATEPRSIHDWRINVRCEDLRELELAKQENLLPFAAALQEELGLKLESTRGPVAVLVIDSVQQPTEN